MKKNFLFIAVIAWFVCLMMTGCAPDDKKLAEHVKSGITLLDSNIQVDVKGGVVTLSGMVMDESTKNAAESVVKEIKGVRSVVNKTTVMAQVAGDEPDADDRLKHSIDSAFASIDIKGVTVAVSKGEVTLHGTVKTVELGKVMKAANESQPKRIVNNLKVD